ncbi:MAG: PqqD family protein [Candidatus Krumholzibacteriia bacterium]
MGRMASQAVPRRNEEAVWREVEDEIFVCSPDGETMHTLREVAADIWRACDGANSVADIHALLLEAYEVEPAVLRADLEACLGDLATRDLLRGLDG